MAYSTSGCIPHVIGTSPKELKTRRYELTLHGSHARRSDAIGRLRSDLRRHPSVTKVRRWLFGDLKVTLNDPNIWVAAGDNVHETIMGAFGGLTMVTA